MKKYEVWKEDLIHKIDDYGEMTLGEIKEFAENFLGNNNQEYGVVFTSREDINEDMEYIEKYGEEDWYLGNYEVIYIKEV